MIINIGSQNQTKINAVVDTLRLYPDLFPDPKVYGIDVRVKEFGHPKNLDQTIKGAVKRAKKLSTIVIIVLDLRED